MSTINFEHFQSFYKYMNSFDAFSNDFFGVETAQDLNSERIINLVGHEDLLLAHICWNILFTQGQTFVMVFPSLRLAHHWNQRVRDALIRTLPEYMSPGFKKNLNDRMMTGNGNEVYFRVLNENTCRGMTISKLYMVEPQLVNQRIHENFVQSAYPALTSGKRSQIVRFSRDQE